MIYAHCWSYIWLNTLLSKIALGQTCGGLARTAHCIDGSDGLGRPSRKIAVPRKDLLAFLPLDCWCALRTLLEAAHVATHWFLKSGRTLTSTLRVVVTTRH